MSHFDNIHNVFALMEGAYSQNTIKSYYADVVHFVDWCDANDIVAFPISDANLIKFIDDHRMSHKYSTIRRKFSALKKINSILGYDDVEHSQIFNLLLRKMKRSQNQKRRQAKGINQDLLIRMINSQTNNITGIRNKAILSLGYDFLARRSELVALKTADIDFLRSDGIRSIIRRSKNDQFGEGRLVYGSKRSAKLLKTWMKQLPNNSEYLFRPVYKENILNRALCERSINEIIKKSVVKTRGHRPREREVSGHSLRVGAAQDLMMMGHDLPAIMRAGGWNNIRVVSRYLQMSEHNIWDQ